MAERMLKEYLLKKVKRMRGEARKVRWEGRNFAPDWRVMIPEHHPFWLELKDTNKEPEIMQAREHDHMRRCGEYVFWANSTIGVDIIIGKMRYA